jgi:hypothetical protein
MTFCEIECSKWLLNFLMLNLTVTSRKCWLVKQPNMLKLITIFYIMIRGNAKRSLDLLLYGVNFFCPSIICAESN